MVQGRHRELLIGVVVALSCVAPSALAQKAKPAPPPSRVEQADALYAKRDELARVREAIKLLEQALTADATAFEATWRLAKFRYYLADHTSDERERDRAFQAGIDVGAAAIALKPSRPEGHFWRG